VKKCYLRRIGSLRWQRCLSFSSYISGMKMYFFGILILTLGIAGCKKPETFPPEPVIKFKEFRQEASGGAVLIFSFTDGDGDVGLDNGDTLAPFDKGSLFHYNLWCDYYEYQNEEWKKIELPEDAAFFYRVPKVEPTGQNPALNGELELKMPFYYDPSSPFEQFEFRFRLADRSLNVSNEERTGTLTKP